jgi:hypothetical protein
MLVQEHLFRQKLMLALQGAAHAPRTPRAHRAPHRRAHHRVGPAFHLKQPRAALKDIGAISEEFWTERCIPLIEDYHREEQRAPTAGLGAPRLPRPASPPLRSAPAASLRGSWAKFSPIVAALPAGKLGHELNARPSQISNHGALRCVLRHRPVPGLTRREPGNRQNQAGCNGGAPTASGRGRCVGPHSDS